ncbi:MAG: RHS repeat-associated core domain-containing protein [Nanoarchaeota archaeon]
MGDKALFILSLVFFAVLLSSLHFSSAIEIEYNLTYDANGNLIQGFDKYFEYDGLNRLTEVRESDENGVLLEQYFYDSVGNRIKKITYNGAQNETTYYIDKNFVQVVNSSGTFNYTYYYADGLLLAAKDPSGKKQFYHPDHLGSTNLITNESGQIIENTIYSPYGEVTDEGQESRYLFTGKEFDRSTDLYYYGARYYDPITNHFIQPDSQIQDVYNPQDLNRYSYARNNPYRYTDPSGNAVNLVTGAIGATIGGGASFIISVISQYSSTGQVNWADAGKDTAAGLVAGGVSGLTFGAGAVLLGGELSSGSIMILMGASGSLGSGVGQITSNLLYDRAITDNVPQAAIAGGALSVATAGAVKGGSSILKSLNINSGFNKLNFASKEALIKHFESHGNDFGFTSSNQYLKASQNFLAGKAGKGVLEYTRPIGDVVRYNPQTNEFGVKTAQGTIRTYFKPTEGARYYASDKANYLPEVDE